MTSTKTTLGRQFIAAIVTAGALLAGIGTATAWASTGSETHHTGPDYWSITGARVGAPGELDVSNYGGSHKHLWVEQQLYGNGVVDVPQVDTPPFTKAANIP